jgi:2,3-diketo-5-methylthio-1-phosphopentane phosphatase
MIEIFSDFDGTLTNHDTLDLLLQRFAPPQWRDLDRAMLSGEISEREGLKLEMALIQAPDDLLLSTLETEILPAEGIEGFISLARRKGWPLHIVSGGLVAFAGALLKKWGYGDIPLWANDHRRNAAGGIEVIEAATPRLKENCSHCKSYHLQQALKRGSKIVYIGDGLTDYCPALLAHRAYAKANLLEHLRKHDFPAVPFDNLRQVARHLEENPV